MTRNLQSVIGVRLMRVHFVGEPDDAVSITSQHGRALAAAGVDVTFDAADQPWRSVWCECDVIHLVSYETRDFSLLRRIRTARSAGVVVFRYWTGLDVLWAACHEPTRRVARALTDLGVVQLAPNDALADRLARMDIPALMQRPVCLCVSTSTKPQALPGEFTLLCHLPTRRRALYGGRLVDRLISSLPGVRFLILGDAGRDYSRCHSVESLGLVDDIRRSIHRCTAVLQPRLFQGASRLVLEAMSLGRHAITSTPMPHAQHAVTEADVVRTIRALRSKVEFNLEGREHVGRKFNRNEVIVSLRRRMEQALAPGRMALAFRGRLSAASLALRMPVLFSRRRFDLPDPEQLGACDEATRLLVSQAHDAPALV